MVFVVQPEQSVRSVPLKPDYWLRALLIWAHSAPLM
jgi:hypothetical protein